MAEVQRKPKKLVIQVIVAAVVALVVGVAAIALVFMVIGNVTNSAQHAQQQAKEELEKKDAELARLRAESAKKVVVAPVNSQQVQAITDIAAGEPITQGLVAAVEVPGMPTQDAYTRIPDVLGKVAKVAIVAGEPLTSKKVMDSGNLLQVKEGMRAVTVGMDRIASLDGALMPGSFVDVLMTVEDSAAGTTPSPGAMPAPGGESMIKTLLQNVQVISVGGNTMGGSASASSTAGGGVTFLVTPSQAELLVLAGQKTKLTLALRNFKDKSRVKVAGADLDRLIIGPQPGIAAKAKSPKASKAVKRGSAMFDNGRVPVTYTPQALPEPTAPAAQPKQRYSMKIYTGAGSQTVEFD